ncbi:hypothetical protein [Terrabacter carboxydivorans]|uniref:Uncharacterized protein n=1 Tax=Terrabacter carboxydivorans TaxID=619730 RepID=A0ABN3MMK6_9MICO
MSDLRSFARETERSLTQPPFELMIAIRRRVHRRRAAVTVAAAVAAVLALVLAVAGLSQLGHKPIPARPAPHLTTPDLPSWTADEIVGNADAFILAQSQSRTQPGTVLTVWKRCTRAVPDHDCLGREAIAVVDRAGHRFVTLTAVTDSSQHPSPGGDGLFREVGDGRWYWAHQNPGPYLVSATMGVPVQLTVLDRPFTRSFGVPTVECADQVGVCTLNEGARTLERLLVPDVPDTRWAIPTAKGCGLWGLAGVGAHLRLIIQQRDGTFAGADLPDTPMSVSLAEGGSNCEVAYYHGVVLGRNQLVVSLDQGRTWQIREARLPQEAGYVEQQPRLRVLIPPHWQALPPMSHALPPPGALHPL